MMPPEDPFLEDEAELREWLSQAPDWAPPLSDTSYHAELSDVFGLPVFVDGDLPPTSALYGAHSYEFSPDSAEHILESVRHSNRIAARRERIHQRGVLGTIMDWLKGR